MQNGYTDDQHHFHSAAANPEMDDDGLPIVTPVTTAFQQFRRDRSATIRQNLLSSGLPADVGSLGTAIGKAWGDLEISSRSRYEQVAAVDKERFIRESHQRDIAATERALDNYSHRFQKIPSGIYWLIPFEGKDSLKEACSL